VVEVTREVPLVVSMNKGEAFQFPTVSETGSVMDLLADDVQF
jgi:hypothetical protein